MIKSLLATICCVLAAISSIHTQNNAGSFNPGTKDSLNSDGKRIYYTSRFLSRPPVIDGKVNDACWEEGYWSGDYLQHLPNEAAKPSQKTEINILYDNKNMYVAIRAYDHEPEKIDKQLGRRDDFGGDMVGINFDSYNDKRTGFEFNLNAGGGKLDLLLGNDGWDMNWDAIWEGKTALEDSAWTAEFRIPLSQLRYNNNKEQVWGMHSWRWINRYQEEDNWQLIPRDNQGLIRSFGEIRGISNLPKSRRIELLPYALAKIKFYEKEEGNPFASGTDFDYALGLDGKIGVSSDFTIDFTINPDFGQVEADPAQLNLSAFETFFDEKRPFFLEGKNITDFSFGEGRLFYSRRIGRSPVYTPTLNEGEYAQDIENTSILGALKLTGKTKNGLSAGIINGLTAKESVTVQTMEGEKKVTAEPLSNYFVARIQQDINKGNTMIGGMITQTNRHIENSHLEFLPGSAITGGIDFFHHWKDKSYFMVAKTIFSHTRGSEESITNLQYSSARYYQRPDASHLKIDSSLTHLSGFGGELEIGKRSNGRWRYNGLLRLMSPGLELNTLGYLPSTDQINQEVNVDYVVNEPSGNIREYSIHLGQNNNFDFSRQYLGSSLHASGKIKFKNKWNYDFNYNRFFTKLDTKILRGGPAIYIQGLNCMSASFHSDDSKKLSYGLTYHVHVFDENNSNRTDIMPGISYKVNTSLIVSTNLTYTKDLSGLQYVWTKYDNTYFLASLSQKTLGVTVRLDYAITPELTIQYYGNPFVSVGKYANYKIITDPKAKRYENLYYEFSGNSSVYHESSRQYDLSYEGITYQIDNPDFNVQQFRSNLVVRWEYKMGSTFYFVWSNNRYQYQDITNFSVNDNIGGLIDTRPENLFLVKFNYWFSI